MTKRRTFLGLSLPALLLGTIALGTIGNLSSCSDLPPVVYESNTPAYVGISIKNDTAVDALSYTLGFQGFLEWNNTCANGLVEFASEVTSHGCTGSASVNGSGLLNVSITGCSSSLPSRTNPSGLFRACYRPKLPIFAPGDDGLSGTCTATNNSTGALACGVSFKATVVTEAYQVSTIPATFSSNSGQARVSEMRLGTDTLLNWTNFTLSNDTGNLKFLDTSDVDCCTALTGTSIGCPHAGGNIKIAIPAQTFPAGCSIEQNLWVIPGDRFLVKVTCNDGIDFIGKTVEPLVKFCYAGDAVGQDSLDSICGAIAQHGSGLVQCHFSPLFVNITS